MNALCAKRIVLASLCLGVLYKNCTAQPDGRKQTWGLSSYTLPMKCERSRTPALSWGTRVRGVRLALIRRSAPTSPTAWARCTRSAAATIVLASRNQYVAPW